MHAINHPYTKHLCESVWDVDPIAVTNNEPVGLVWLSPDCKHFSKAKGGTPVNKHIRGLAWVGMRWVALCKPRVLMLENVEEFQTWGPLVIAPDGTAKPDPQRKGETFRSFVWQLRKHGYQVEWRELRACDFGAPTIRKRLFLIARRDGQPIVWPQQSHAEPSDLRVLAGMLAAHRTAAECIDFSLPAASIFNRKRALVNNTMRRTAKGLWRHVLSNPQPYVVSSSNLASDDPVLTPFIGEHANASNDRTMPADAPLRTICAQVKGGHFSVIAPTLAALRGTSEQHLSAHDVQAPLSTVSAGGNHHALVGASLVTIGYGERRGQDARTQDIRRPLGTVVTANKHAIVAAHLTHLTHHGERHGHSVAEPLRTITAAHRGEQAIVMACLEQANGGFYEGDGRAADAPMSTITASGSNQRLVTAYLVKYYSVGGQDSACDEPMHTVPTKDRMGLATVVQVEASALAPHHIATARLCAQLLHEHLPEHFPELADVILLHHGGQCWALVDITLRMLKPRELYQAQGFPRTYQFDQVPDPAMLFADGQQTTTDVLALPRKALTGEAQVRMVGNSVSPYVSEALARVNFAHEHQIVRAA